MHLIPCSRPTGALEPAPGTSLREAAAGEEWAGFWSIADERFYTRCVSLTSGERWFRIADASEAHPAPDVARVLPFPFRRTPTSPAPRMMVGRYRGHAMLVGMRARRQPAGLR